MNCFEGIIWSKEIGQWNYVTTNLMLEMSKDLLQDMSPLDLSLTGKSAFKPGACSFCNYEREKSCQDFWQLHIDLGECKHAYRLVSTYEFH